MFIEVFEFHFGMIKGHIKYLFEKEGIVFDRVGNYLSGQYHVALKHEDEPESVHDKPCTPLHGAGAVSLQCLPALCFALV